MGALAAERARRVGVLFCGGRSRRMGRDKALLRLGGETLLERGARALEAVTGRVLLACGPADRYGEFGWERVLDEGPPTAGELAAGPLAGLGAALRSSGAEWVVALACDLPRADPLVLEALARRARERDLDACLLETPAGLEPLFAVYRDRALGAVDRALARGERRMVAFHDDGVRVGTLRVEELPGSSADWTRNLNTPEDFELEASA